ncbi:MAG TPA: PucR family transcriptional regulator ligand-binding domain-containing protein [Solirubrobacteraceae bacterium]|nr:PucR family transcriptional regulator ligand-binding domain-containing protein [Solirubrobacteraceae bacterium]
MSLTVGELVTRPKLRLELLVAGDLDREIRWIHSSEMPDPAPYLRGGEVVLTAGIWFWRGIAPSAFAEGLGVAQAAAVGFGTNPMVSALPDELTSACESWGLTLFRVPEGVSFIEIAEEFVEAQHRERERPLLDSLDRSSQFLYSLQAGGGVAGVLRVLMPFLGRQVAVVQRGRDAIVAGVPGTLPPELVAAAEAAIGTAMVVELDGASAFPVPIASSDAVLLIDGSASELTVTERSTIDQGLAFLAIELQRVRAVSESELRFAGELFDLLAVGEAQHPAVTARLRTFGLDFNRPLVAVCCDSPDAEASPATARVHLEDSRRRSVLAVKATQLLGLVEIDQGDDLAELARGLHNALGTASAVGVGGIAEEVGDLARSVIEARHACRFARRRQDAGYATHDMLASHALLLAVQDDRLLEAFRETLIRPLEEHDARRGTELLKTLDSFLRSGGKYQDTADALHLHVNTLRLRLTRIESLTGRDLHSMDDRVDLWIALRTRRPDDT